MKFRLILVIFIFFGVAAVAQKFPEPQSPPRLVNDYIGALTKSELQSLEAKLLSYNDTTSTEVAVVIIESTDGYPIDDYTFRLGEKWGIGRADKDNGVLVLVALGDRDIFIATGYGMEGVLPDAIVKRIIENDIKPAFRAGDYYGGLDAATTDIILAARGEYTGSGSRAAKKFPWFIIPIFLLIFIIPVMVATRKAKRYAALNDIPFWTAWMLLNQASRTHRRSSGGPWGGGGGWSSGGGGGGFGGFGGGSFGGGGAGGSW